MSAQPIFVATAVPISGAAMDRHVPGRARRRALLAGVALLLVAAVVAGALWVGLPRGVEVKAADLTIATVQTGQFRDELLVRANAAALTSVMLDATEGGRVEAVYVRDGATVRQGDKLFRLSNPQLQQEVLARAADVAQQVTNLASLQVGLRASHTAYRRDVASLEFQLDQARKALARQSDLAAQGFVSSVSLEDAHDKVALQERLLDEARADMAEELATRERAIGQMGRAIDGLDAGLKLVRATADALVVTAAVDGRLVDFRLEQGESVKPGDRVGRIDSPDRYKLVASVDEFYLTRIAPGLAASADIDNRAYAVSVSRVNPQVKERSFVAELTFDSVTPSGLQPGQTVDLRVTLGKPSEALLLPDGAFIDDGGAHWVFVLSADQHSAERREVRLGRRAGNRAEVLRGLAAGERVIVSTYRAFRDAQRLRIVD